MIGGTDLIVIYPDVGSLRISFYKQTTDIRHNEKGKNHFKILAERFLPATLLGYQSITAVSDDG